jgi:hypothetical protein
MLRAFGVGTLLHGSFPGASQASEIEVPQLQHRPNSSTSNSDISFPQDGQCLGAFIAERMLGNQTFDSPVVSGSVPVFAITRQPAKNTPSATPICPMVVAIVQATIDYQRKLAIQDPGTVLQIGPSSGTPDRQEQKSPEGIADCPVPETKREISLNPISCPRSESQEHNDRT